jgi:hypothetical protein
VKRIRAWIEEARELKHVEHHHLDRIIQRCLRKFGYLFPHYRCSKNGSKTVHHFNVPDVQPISIERPHGSREFIPRRYAQMIIEGLEGVADYIEMNREDKSDDDTDNGENSEVEPR